MAFLKDSGLSAPTPNAGPTSQNLFYSSYRVNLPGTAEQQSFQFQAIDAQGQAETSSATVLFQPLPGDVEDPANWDWSPKDGQTIAVDGGSVNT